MSEQQYFDTVIVGAGPAGLGPIVHAMKVGLIDDLLKQKILVLEKASTLGSGSLGDHIINSDTPASVFLEIMDGHAEEHFSDLLNNSHAKKIVDSGSSFVALKTAGRFLEEMGDVVEGLFTSSAASDLRRESAVNRITINEEGRFIVEVYDGILGQSYSVNAKKVVLACGARQREIEKINSVFGCDLDLRKYPILMSSDLLKGEADAIDFIGKINQGSIKKVSILGSSHSAFSSALVICKRIAADVDVKIDILFRREPKVFYASVEDAIAERYLDFAEEDICPTTKRVFRFAGLRMESRDLLRSMLSLGDAKKDKRLNLVKIEERNTSQLDAALSDSDLVIVAFGYDFLGVPIFDAKNNRIPLGTDQSKYVDQHCRILNRSGTHIHNLYGIGLASGYVPDNGGEKSFFGQTNSLWIYQNPAGKIIFDALRETS